MPDRSIGVISDTHGLLRPQAAAALAGVELILHAGDVGGPEILEALGRIAPVTAVRGNVDLDGWAEALPDRALVRTPGGEALVLHDASRLRPEDVPAQVALVVAGHSHRPSVAWENGRLRLNPGSAGPRRFKLPVCLAVIAVEDGALRPRLIDLDPAGPNLARWLRSRPGHSGASPS